MKTGLPKLFLYSVIFIFSDACFAENEAGINPANSPLISIIIDDMGYQLENGRQAIQLPGPLTFSILPGTPHAKTLAQLAHQHNKEVMLHLPLEPMSNKKTEKNSITLAMNETQTRDTLIEDINNVPYVIGINNHMGSLFTQYEKNLHWLMNEIKLIGNLYFVDSYTNPASIAMSVAAQHNIPTTKRDVFLDNNHTAEDIDYQFSRLLRKARKNGSALAIAHPHKETIEYLQNKLLQLDELGVKLVPVSRIIEHENVRSRTWPVSLSRSHKAAKSLNP